MGVPATIVTNVCLRARLLRTQD